MGKKARAKASKKAKKAPVAGREAVLVALQEDPKHLVELGAHHPAARIFTFVDEVLAHAAKDEAALAPLGFDAAWRAELKTAVDDGRTRAQARTETTPALHEESAAVAEKFHDAHAWIKRYTVVCRNSGPAIRAAAPKVGHLSHERKTVADALDRYAAFVDDHAVQTERQGGGAAFAAKGHELAEKVREARLARVAAKDTVTPEVLALHAAIGLVYAECVRVARAAEEALPAERAKVYHVGALRQPVKHAPADAPAKSAPAAKAARPTPGTQTPGS
jgi:hypothetical protein